MLSQNFECHIQQFLNSYNDDQKMITIKKLLKNYYESQFDKPGFFKKCQASNFSQIFYRKSLELKDNLNELLIFVTTF